MRFLNKTNKSSHIYEQLEVFENKTVYKISIFTETKAKFNVRGVNILHVWRLVGRVQLTVFHISYYTIAITLP